MLDAIGVERSFGERTLFEGVSLRVQKGDKIGLVGPNGVGKTTLLRMLAGVDTPDDGQVALKRDTRVGYLEQDVKTNTSLHVLDYVVQGAPETLALADELAKLEHALAVGHEDASGSLSIENLSARHAEVREAYAARDGYTLVGRAREILKGLGFAATSIEQPMSALSGGWAMRAELGRLLLGSPDVLLLDEPTNHLDQQSLLWLEDFLSDYPGAYLVVSHDRYFLNRMVTSIAELSPDGLFVFGGNYEDYIEARAELEEQFLREQAGKQRQIAEIKSFIERFGAKATKARQANSRKKKLERVQAEVQSAGLKPKHTKRMHMQLPDPVRAGDVVATLTNVSKSYGAKVIYQGLSLTVRRGDKIALVGDNGAGKSTLLKMLAGALAPDGGERRLGQNVEPYYFAQHQLDVLNPNFTGLEEMRSLLPLESETRVRGILGAFLFSGEAAEKPVKVLSGGEKSRLVLAKMLAKPKNFLLLDEPTNHLDLQSREVLEEALADFKGTLCCISHDRYFVNRVANKIWEIRPGGVVVEYGGDYDYYLWKRETEPQAIQDPTTDTQAVPATDKAQRIAAREAEKAAAKEGAKKQKELAKVEGVIAVAEGRVKEIDTLLCDVAVFADHQKARELMLEREKLQEELAPLYAQWEALAG